MTSTLRLEFTTWEDGELVDKILTAPDRWAVHGADEVVVHLGYDVPPIRIIQQPKSIHAKYVGVGACLWDGAILLAGYLAAQPRHRYVGSRCIELGAGVSLVSIVLAHLGAHVVSTDIQKVMSLLWQNLESNGYPRDSPVANTPGKGWVEGEELEWGKEGWMKTVERIAQQHPPLDLVLAADCCYVDQDGQSPSTPDFVKTCVGLCRGSDKTKCLVAFERRSSEVRRCFLEESEKAFEHVVKIPTSSLPPGLQLEYCDLWELQKPFKR